MSTKSARNSYLKRTYGITEDQYNEIFESQAGCCAICGRHQSQFKTRLAVEHCHQSPYRIRGLACTYCNRYLIGRHKDADLLRRIADYLERGTDYYVPVKPKKRAKRKPV